MLVEKWENIITSQCSHHRLNFDSFRGQHQCTRTSIRERDGGCIYPNKAWLLQVAVSSSPDSLLVLRGHQGDSGRQRLPQDQDRQAPIWGSRGRWRPRTRPASRTLAAPPQRRPRRGSGCSWQQPVPAYRPARRAKQKLKPKGYIGVCTQFYDVCTFHKMYVAICTRNISCTYLDIHVCKIM
jgi:hypothetical protein